MKFLPVILALILVVSCAALLPPAGLNDVVPDLEDHDCDPENCNEPPLYGIILNNGQYYGITPCGNARRMLRGFCPYCDYAISLQDDNYLQFFDEDGIEYGIDWDGYVVRVRVYYCDKCHTYIKVFVIDSDEIPEVMESFNELYAQTTFLDEALWEMGFWNPYLVPEDGEIL
jgi:hypothetical protein